MEIQANLKLFKILGDDTRLKLLAILRKSEFTVSELVHILGLHQSNISRHLTQLRDAKLVQDRREGTLVYYRWSEKLNDSNEISSLILSAWTNHDEKIILDSKMNEALELRKSQSKSFFDLVAGQYQEIAQVGGGAQGLIHAMALLIQSRCAADIGCGEGYLSQTLAMNCNSVIAIDQSQKMLDVLIENSDKDGIFNIDARLGDIEDLPIQAAECDLLFLSQVLHHAATPEKVLREAHRVLEKNGRIVILDLLSHDQEWVREKMGDLWLGFDINQLKNLLELVGFNVIQKKIIPIEGGLPLILLNGIRL